MPRYRAAGVDIESELALPGLLAADGVGAAADVEVRVGETPAGLPGALERGANWERAAGALLLDIPGLARFLIREAGEIVVEPAAGVAPGELAIFIAGTMLGLLLHLRGRILLQASAVAVAGGAVLFCGSTSAGKSTLAAALGRRGYPTICDDLCAIDFAAPGEPRAVADSTTLKLWAQTIKQLALEAGPPVRPALRKHHVAPPSGSVAAAPVRAIYMLIEARPPHPPQIARANVADLALIVRRNAFRHSLVRALDQQAAYLMAAAQLASAAGIFSLERPLGFERLEAGMDDLEAHWTHIGLAPARVS